MPGGKPAGVRCIQLDDANHCRLFGSPLRPAVCGGFPPHADSCGASNPAALRLLTELERLTG
jgi:hypothetical protein